MEKAKKKKERKMNDWKRNGQKKKGTMLINKEGEKEKMRQNERKKNVEIKGR